MGEIFEKLGITWQGMLFHFIALIVLIVGLVFLLYKPVKKIIAENKRKLGEVFDENERLSQESSQAKSKYESMVAEVKDEVLRVSQESSQKAQALADEIVKEAHSKAEHILKDAQNDAQATRTRLNTEFKQSVGKMAVEIASKVLEREVSENDNKDIIDACLTEWEK